MAVAYIQEFAIGDRTTTNYDFVADKIGEGPFEGLIAHTAGFDDEAGVFRILDVWESREAADKKAQAIVDDLRASKMGKAADLVEQAVHETLTYYSFPDIHWQKIRTNNPLERIMKEIRRRTRVVGAFPDGQSCLNLAAARLRYIAGTTWSAKCYMNMRPLYQPQVVQTEAVA